jgi:large subunit ribosomal protein L3
MITGIWGKKIGMTQVFAGEKAVPVTVFDVSNWVVTQVKTKERDGYNAVQVGCIKDKHANAEFAEAWLKKPNAYFRFFKEITLHDDAAAADFVVGAPLDMQAIIAAGDNVDVRGTSKGCGFAGVIRRHNFAGGRSSHGSTMGRRPGSLSFMRSQGRVIKGKKMPGHMGTTTHMVRNLDVVQVRPEDKLILVKGSVPGKAGSLVFIRKAKA